MADNGFVKIHRQITEWTWYKNANVTRLFLHLLVTCAYKPFNEGGKDYPAGTRLTTHGELAAELGLTIKQIRGALKKLSFTNEICEKRASKKIVISVIKWAKYQCLADDEGNQRAIKGQSKGNQRAITDPDTLYKEESKERKEGKEKENIKEIIAYLNEKAGTNYRATSAATQKHIHARLAEGYTVDDFMTVIDKKVAEWKGTKMEQYLRPETLFGTKFENYLNAPAPQKEKGMFDFLDDFLKGEDVVNG